MAEHKQPNITLTAREYALFDDERLAYYYARDYGKENKMGTQIIDRFKAAGINPFSVYLYITANEDETFTFTDEGAGIGG